MGLFDKFHIGKKSAEPETAPAWPAVIAAPAKGKVIPMKEIPDGVFSQGILGECCAVRPEEGNVYSPVDGKITLIADTLHAIGLEDKNGVEVLLHIGIDTVSMNGDGFQCQVRNGQSVKKGQLLVTMDLDKIRAAGHATDVIIILTNVSTFSKAERVASGSAEPGTELYRIFQ